MDRALRHPKFLISIFVKEIKEEIETMFAMNFARKENNSWNIRHLVDNSFVPANQRIIF